MMVFMHRIMFSCETATLMVSKSFHQKLTFAEKQRLKMHLLTCKPCRDFKTNSIVLNKGIDKMNRNVENIKTYRLSEDTKKKMVKSIHENL